MSRNAAQLGPEFTREFDKLDKLMRFREWTAIGMASGAITREKYLEVLPAQDSLARDIMLMTSSLEQIISRRIQHSLAIMEVLERRRLFILGLIFPLALLTAGLTAWFGEKARRLNQRLVRNAAEEALLRDAMAALTHGDVPLSDALGRIAAIAMRVADAEGACIEQCDDARNMTEVVAAAGGLSGALGSRDSFVDSFSDDVVRSGQPHFIPDLSIHPGNLGSTIAERCGQCSGLIAPLHHDGDVDGVMLLVWHDRDRTVTNEELIPRLWVLGALAALALRRHRLTGALEEERQRLKGVVAEMPAGVILAEAPSGRILLANRQAVEILRGQTRPPESIEEYDVFNCYRPDGSRYTPAELPLSRSIRAGEQVQGEEAEIEHTDGQRSILRLSSAPIRDARGGIVAGVTTMYDISEQKRREQANIFLDEVSRVLAASLDYEATLKALLQLCVPRLADFAVLYLRIDQDKAIRRFESTPEDTDTRELLETIDREYVVPLAGRHPSAMAIRTGKPQLHASVNIQLLKEMSQDEEHLQLLRQLDIHSMMAAPLTVRGKTLGALLLVSQNPDSCYGPKDLELAEELARRAALAVDNAELFRTVSQGEKRARFLADAVQSFSVTLDYNETIRRVVRLAVPFFADMTIAFLTDEQGQTHHVEVAHRDPRAEVLLEKAGDLYRPGPNNMASTVVRAVRTGQPVLIERVTPEQVDELELNPEIRALWDRLGPVSWLTVPLLARETTLGAISFVFAESKRHYDADDISLGQLLASRAALAMQNARLFGEVQEALRTRDEVLAIVSHDLRNPLHTISMSTDLLLEMPTDERKKRHLLEMISHSGSRMERLIQDLLDVARIEAGKSIAIEPARVPAHTLVREACEQLLVQAREKNIKLECSASDDLPPVYADHDRILQVMSNLIGNALKFTPEAGRVDVSAQVYNGNVKVSVKDTGSGVRQEDRDSIFLPFWQSMRTGRAGAGLGLTIARAIVEEHKGQIWLETTSGAGSVFCFTLPMGQQQEEE
ncbi:MAG: GAF domain-containing protein, partial [Longimicrobiales bacterium]